MISVFNNKGQLLSFVVSVVLSILLVAFVANGTTYVDTDSVGVATDTPGAALSVKGQGIFEGFVRADYFTSTSTNPSWFFGLFGLGTTTPGAELSVVGAALVDGHVTASNFTATSTTATSTFNGGLSLAESAGTLGIGTSTPGNAANVGIEGQEVYQSSGATTTLTVTSSSATQGGCIQLLHPQSGQYWRLYIGSDGNGLGGGAAGSDGLVIEVGECQ